MKTHAFATISQNQVEIQSSENSLEFKGADY